MEFFFLLFFIFIFYFFFFLNRFLELISLKTFFKLNMHAKLKLPDKIILRKILILVLLKLILRLLLLFL